MDVEVKLFAIARQLACADSVLVELPETATARDVRRVLAEACPALAGLLPRMLIAVDAEYADDSTPIRPGCEVACIPPVSGG